MYRIYQTEGWVLGSINVGEANKFIDILTPDFGLVRGMAQGVRKLESKLRYGLQDYFFGTVSLVRGRELWRIVGVQKIDDFDWLYKDRSTFRMVCRVLSLLRRLIHGEEKDASIFFELNRALTFLGANRLSVDDLAIVEVILVFRILQKLGYVGRDSRFNPLADFSDWDMSLIKIDSSMKTALLRQINSSLSHSHL